MALVIKAFSHSHFHLSLIILWEANTLLLFPFFTHHKTEAQDVQGHAKVRTHVRLLQCLTPSSAILAPLNIRYTTYLSLSLLVPTTDCLTPRSMNGGGRVSIWGGFLPVQIWFGLFYGSLSFEMSHQKKMSASHNGEFFSKRWRHQITTCIASPW